MSDLSLVLTIVAVILYALFGIVIAAVDISNREVVTPKELHDDKYNWFGSWAIFITRTLLAIPFYLIFTILIILYKAVYWLFTAGR